MPSKSSWPQGAPSWADLATSDDEAAVSFYGQLFGWTDEPAPMGEDASAGFYHLQKIGDADVVGISRQQPEEAAQGVPPHWNSYITVDDVDATTARVKDAGGAVLAEPFDVLEAGRMSVIQDPTGAIVSLWEARDSIGAELVGDPGAIAWQELVTPDAARAAAFFETLLGVETATAELPEGPPYTLLRVGGEDVGGILQHTSEMGDVPPSWMVYFAVEDCDATAARVGSLGGSVTVSPMDIPVGRFAVFADPQGAVFGVMTFTAVP